MSRLAYNLSLLIAMLLIGAGSAAQWGWPIAAMLLGTLIIGLTFVGLYLTAPRKD
ncbi:MAG TPA: hypothetical protein VGK09_08320 [Rhodocyclaceae bacterium]|jgi:hypothetical protein